MNFNRFRFEQKEEKKEITIEVNKGEIKKENINMEKQKRFDKVTKRKKKLNEKN